MNFIYFIYFRGRGVFYSKLVIPAQAGIQRWLMFGSPHAWGHVLDARLRGHDRKNSPAAQSIIFLALAILSIAF
jgi:hypothetical protein